MKNLSLLFCMSLIMLFTSCADDPCDGIVNGVDQNGTCVCTGNFSGSNCTDCNDGFTGENCDECVEGLSGENCDIETRTTYYGTWSGTLSGCSVQVPLLGEYPIPEGAPVTIMVSENGSDLTKVAVDFGITGFLDESTEGTITGDQIVVDEFSISFDVMGFPLSINFSGEGMKVSDTQIDMIVTINAGAGDSECPLTLTKG